MRLFLGDRGLRLMATPIPLFPSPLHTDTECGGCKMHTRLSVKGQGPAMEFTTVTAPSCGWNVKLRFIQSCFVDFVLRYSVRSFYLTLLLKM